MLDIKNIFIYAGPGTSATSIQHISYLLHAVVDTKRYSIHPIDAPKIIEGKWRQRTALMIFPGGADLPYCAHLNGLGNDQLTAYVNAGGAFLGICAGAYYASQYIVFAPDTDIEVKGDRELGFFPGTSYGPILAPYDYHSRSGARVASLLWQANDNHCGQHLKVYYEGGGYFMHPTRYAEIIVLATYNNVPQTLPQPIAAIIERPIGKGKVILSGPHIEYTPNLLDETDAYLAPIKKALLPEEVQRLGIMTTLLKRLGITTR